MIKQQFASDNYSGICPEALQHLEKANRGHVPSYGDDRYTAEACDLFRELFETPCEVFFVFNGTAGNALSLASLCQSYHSVICHPYAHVETDECGAPEFFSHGSKLLLADGAEGRMDPEAARQQILRRTDIHFPRPRALSVTQSTELGTVYRPDELSALGRVAKEHGLNMHMDGARFANAIGHLGVAPRACSVDAGVDVLCLGGSKNGLAFGEAVIFFDRERAHEFDYRCKQAGQLASKMRFVAAQWIGLLSNGTWLRHARHANACARRLCSLLEEIPEVKVLFPVEANAVFVEIPEPVSAALKAKGWIFYSFIGVAGARLMCSWDTTDETMDTFIADLKEELVST